MRETGPQRLALSLYPRAWRARYGEEFQSLLVARRLTFGDWIDIVFGAIDARLIWRDRTLGYPNAGLWARDLGFPSPISWSLTRCS